MTLTKLDTSERKRRENKKLPLEGSFLMKKNYFFK